MKDNQADIIALVGFGEAGQHIGAGLAANGLRVRAYDIRHNEPALVDAAGRSNIGFSGSPSVVEGAALVFSLVTASSAVDAARGR